MTNFKQQIVSLLRWSERYTRTDMVYLASSGFWSNMATMSVTLFSLALYLVFANVLSKETFGTYQYLLSLGAFIGALTLTGMNSAVSRAVAQGFEGTLRQAVRFQIAWIWLPILAALVGSAYYAIAGNIELSIGLLIVGVGTPLISTYNTYSAFLLGKQDFRRSFFLNLAINVPFYTALILAAFMVDEPILLVGISMAIQAIGYFAAYRATLRIYRPGPETQAGTLTYGTHLSFMGLPGTIAQHIDAILAFHFLGPVGVAVYAFATAIPERITGLFKFLPTAALPRFAQRHPDEIRATILPRLLLVLPLLGLAALLYAIAAPYIFALLFPAYVEAIPFSQWYGLVLISVLTQVLVSALSAHKRIRALYAFNILSPVMQIVFQVAGVVSFGMWGLIIGRLCGHALSLLLALTLTLHTPRLRGAH